VVVVADMLKRSLEESALAKPPATSVAVRAFRVNAGKFRRGGKF
jgi:hypothetical protein